MRAVGALGLLLLLAGSGAAHDMGRLEREALQDALELRGLVVDPAPEGKTIAQVQVVTLEVFSKRDWRFQIFNILHRSTRENIIRREALFAAGQPYRQDLIDETWRNLQNPDLSSAVVVVPVKSATPGAVDVLIVTRDVWSLRLNTDFVVQQTTLLSLSASLSENNLFGWRKQAALVFDMNQGSIAVGPSYIDRNIAGTRMTLTSSASAYFSREELRPEGGAFSTVVRYPLYSLASRWGAAGSVAYSNGVVRQFTGNNLATVDFRSTPDITERWPWIYRVRNFGTGGSVTRSFGKAVIQRVAAGYGYSVVRPSFTFDFPDDPPAKAEFAREIFPPSERISDVFASYSMFTPRYLTYRDLDTFDLSEISTMGPSASASLTRGARALGGDRDFYGVAASAGWRLSLGNGLQSVSAGWSGRVYAGGRLQDQSYSAGLYLASPVLARRLRLVGSLGAGAYIDDTHNNFFVLGGDTAMRGYLVGDLRGKSEFLAHLEARSMALSVASFRLGGVVFTDVGDAASPDPGSGTGLARAIRSVRLLRAKSDVGWGVRLLIPQLNTYVLRFDWAFPLESTRHTLAGWPGRITFTFRQAF
jgi:outer membrane protein assembly factor BamA